MIDISKGIRAEADRAKFFADVIALIETHGSLDNAIQERKKALEEVNKSITAQTEIAADIAKKAADKCVEFDANFTEHSAKTLKTHAGLMALLDAELDAGKDSVAKIKKSITELDKSLSLKTAAGEKKLADIEAAIVVESKRLEDIKAAITAIAGR